MSFLWRLWFQDVVGLVDLELLSHQILLINADEDYQRKRVFPKIFFDMETVSINNLRL